MTSSEVRTLKQAPAMMPMFAKALVRANVKPGANPVLPNITVRLTDVVLDSKHLAAYRRVCGFSSDGFLPTTYPHMHAHPLFMTLLLDKHFPFAVLGLVHVRNIITQHRPIKEREQLDIECRFGELTRLAKGYEFSIITTVSTGGELVWESESIMFRRGGGTGETTERAPRTASPVPSVYETWYVKENLGRRYGAISGDRNPIHLYAFTAKMFGFKRQIAHGMWSKARCLASLQEQLPTQPFTVDVSFKLPMFIPAKVLFAPVKTEQGHHFRLLAKDGVKPYLEGTVTLADSD